MRISEMTTLDVHKTAIAAAAITSVWCIAHVGYSLHSIPAFWVLQLLEVVHDGTWFAFVAEDEAGNR